MSTLAEYLQQEKSVFDETQKLFQLEIACFDTLDLLNREVARSVNAGHASDGSVAYFMSQLWQISYSYLRTSFLLTLRGSSQEVFTTLRPAIEMVSHLGNIGLSPDENATLWLNQNQKEHKKKYKEIFGRLFPKEIPDMVELRRAYNHCCDIGSHAGHRQLAGRSGVDEETGDYVLYSLNASGEQMAGLLQYILKVILYCLGVFHFSFSKVLTKEGFEPVNDALKLTVIKINEVISCREKQREKYLREKKLKNGK